MELAKVLKKCPATIGELHGSGCRIAVIKACIRNGYIERKEYLGKFHLTERGKKLL